MAGKLSQTQMTAVDTQTGEMLSMDALNDLFGVSREFVPDSVEELEAFYAEQGGLITFQGSPYDVVKKTELVGVPFVIVDIRLYEGKWGDACAILAILENTQRRVVFNDGSTGVLRQCKFAMQQAGRRGGFRCPKGLRVSEYTYVEKDLDGNPLEGAKPTKAFTYYIA